MFSKEKPAIEACIKYLDEEQIKKIKASIGRASNGEILEKEIEKTEEPILKLALEYYRLVNYCVAMVSMFKDKIEEELLGNVND